MESFWERASFQKSDFLIVGGGIIGLCVAIRLKQAFKSPPDVVILDRGLVPHGASTRNAGFACFGSLGEMLADEKVLGTDRLLQIVEMRYQGLKKLLNLVGPQACDYQPVGGFEVIWEGHEAMREELPRFNKLLKGIVGADVFYELSSHDLNSYPFAGAKCMIKNPHEGHLHSGKLIKALMEKAQSLGVRYITGCRVDAIRDDSGDQAGHAKVSTRDVGGRAFDFYAQTVIHCTNAFAKRLLPQLDVVPGRGQVIVTKPLSNLPFRGTFHFDEGYYYFRDLDHNRVLFGGGRNKFREQETTTELEVNPEIVDHLHQILSEVILPGKAPEIDMKWAGIMAFGAERTPIIQRISPREIAAVRMNGMGVSIAAEVAQKVIDIVLDV